MKRLFSIDILRGIVMLLMTIDHTRDMFSSVNIGEHLGASLPWAYYFTRWITHFCAPTFVFLSGLSIALWVQKNATTIRQAQWHIIKRGTFIVMLDVTLVSLLWTIIEKQSIFTVYLAELWAIGFSMILLALLLSFSARTILFIGLIIVTTHDYFQIHYGSTSIISTLLNGNNEFMVPHICQIFANYAILPWFGIACIGYAVGHYLINTKHSMKKQTELFLACALGGLGIFVVLRIFNLYGDTNAFVYHPGEFLTNVYSFLDVTKYPPSLQYTLITLLLTWITLALRPYLDRQVDHPVFMIVNQFGQAALFYYVFHLVLICLYFFLFNQFLPAESLKTANLFIIYGLSALICLTAYPVLLLFKNIRNRYKTAYPILGYI